MDESHEIDIKIGLPEITLDPEKNIRVVDGAPTQKDEFGTLNPAGTEAIIIPNAPHVFTVDHL